MTMETRFILLWLEAPLQSWGADSKFGRRDTLSFPTKSGVMGLLCCAMGASGEQCDLLHSMASLRQTVVSYVRMKPQKPGESATLTKCDREPLLRDFQMVGSGYDEVDPWSTLLIPKTSEGKKAVGGGTKMTYRYYLQDAKFAVCMEVPQVQADTFAQALQEPIFDLYLGRKNCVPTDFVYRGLFSSEEEALAQAALIAQEKEVGEDFRVVDGEQDGDAMTINDVPLQFGTIKKYQDRRVTVIKV